MTTFVEPAVSKAIFSVTRDVARRYRRYVEFEDVSQELYAWVYGDGQTRVVRWLDAEPRQTVRIHYALLDVAVKYAEAEKAQQCGYKPDDVWWYSSNLIESLMPMVLDLAFTQENEHVGELITMVIDIRRAVFDAGVFSFFEQCNESHPEWTRNVQQVLDRLGGELPAVGRRRALTNAAAQSITTGTYE